MLTNGIFLTARILLVAVFGLAALTKLADRDGTRQAFTEFGVPASLAAPFAILVPMLEIFLAAGLIPEASSRWSTLGTVALLLLFSAGIAFNLARGRNPACHCFGELDSESISWKSLVRNAALISVAGLVLAQEWLIAHLPLLARLNELSAKGNLDIYVTAVPLLAALVLVQSWLIYQLWKRGHVVERQSAGGNAFVSNSTQPSSVPFTVPAPGFHLKTLDGGAVTLDHLRGRGKPTLLIFVDPDCRACAKLLPEAERWQREYASLLTVALITQGEPEANASLMNRHSLTNLLLQAGNEVSAAYRVFATPSGILVGNDGNIASPTAWGRREIGLLVSSAIRGFPQAPTSPQEKTTGEPNLVPDPVAE